MQANLTDSQLVQHLLKENEALKQENQLIKEKYEKLLVQYKELTDQQQKMQNVNEKVEEINLQGIIDDLQIKPTSPRNHYLKHQHRTSYDFQDQFIKETNRNLQPKQFMSSTKESPTEEKQSNSQQSNEFQTTFEDIRQSRMLSISQRPHPLIEGCFIIQKKSCKQKNYSLQDMTAFAYPPDIVKTEKQMLDLVLKYTFVNDELTKTEDDQFNSRRNEIVFGTPYEDLTYAFEDNKWNTKKEMPEIMREMGILKKKFVHILLRPQIIELSAEEKGKKKKQEKQKEKPRQQEGMNDMDQSLSQQEEEVDEFLETQIIYGFISSFPLRSFFQDLHRAIQQQIKYSQFSESLDEESKVIKKEEKYEIISNIMKKIVDENYQISDFPIKYTYRAGMTKIDLNIPSIQAFNDIENEFLKFSLSKYQPIHICRILHYVLSERFLIIEAKSRKTLNEILQIIRIMIKPFVWLFATVYVYSDYFQPFMSSPMPLIIGMLKSEAMTSANRESTGVQFVTVDLDEKVKELKQKQIFYKSIKKLKKGWEKNEDKVGTLRKYVKNLNTFITKGVLDQEPTDFHIEFIETQLVSYFKDHKEK